MLFFELYPYVNALIFAIIILFTAFAMLFGSYLLGPKRKNKVKDEIPYECGVVPIETGNKKFSVKFYLVATLFILFDVEIIFIIPWALIYNDMVSNGFGLFLMIDSFIFILILAVGLFYILRKGALKWD